MGMRNGIGIAVVALVAGLGCSAGGDAEKGDHVLEVLVDASAVGDGMALELKRGVVYQLDASQGSIPYEDLELVMADGSRQQMGTLLPGWSEELGITASEMASRTVRLAGAPEDLGTLSSEELTAIDDRFSAQGVGTSPSTQMIDWCWYADCDFNDSGDVECWFLPFPLPCGL
jgi:hypothetical protein